MPLFFNSATLAQATAKLGPKPWPDFNEPFLLQKAPRSFLDEGLYAHEIIRFDGNQYKRVRTRDTKFASWLITEASMAYALGLGKPYFESAQAWVSALVETPVWDPPTRGPVTQAQLDLSYGNLAYACAFFLDICGSACEPVFREKLIKKMQEQIKLGDARFLERPISKHPYTQNHFYIPFTGYLCMCAAVAPYWGEAQNRLKESAAFIPLIFESLGTDGWYYEGLNYCHYAFIWLIRLAALAEQQLGLSVHEAPCLQSLHEFFKWTAFPKGRHFFHIGDNSSKKWCFSSWEEASLVDERNWNDAWINHFSHLLYWVGLKTGNPECRSVADSFKARGLHLNEGFWTLLWDAPHGTVSQKKSHHFEDFGVWAADYVGPSDQTLRLLAKCGPPMGHSLKLNQAGKPAYLFNAGHVHPDAGSVFAAWNDLPILLGPGYLGRKAGAWQNSVTFDGQGQHDDRLYHAFPPESSDHNRLSTLSIEETVAGVRLSFAGAYASKLAVERATRLISSASHHSFELEDELVLSSAARVEARFRISDSPTLLEPKTFEWSVSGTKMRFELLESDLEVRLWAAPGEVTTINDDGSSGPLEAGQTCQRGYQILVQSVSKVTRARWKVRLRVLGGSQA